MAGPVRVIETSFCAATIAEIARGGNGGEATEGTEEAVSNGGTEKQRSIQGFLRCSDPPFRSVSSVPSVASSCVSRRQLPHWPHFDRPLARRRNLRRHLDGLVEIGGVNQIEAG